MAQTEGHPHFSTSRALMPSIVRWFGRSPKQCSYVALARGAMSNAATTSYEPTPCSAARAAGNARDRAQRHPPIPE